MITQPRILLIGQSYGRGHAATSTLFTELAEYLAAHGHCVEVLTSSGSGRPASISLEAGVLLHRVPVDLPGRLSPGRFALALLWLQIVRWCLTTPRRYEKAILLDTPYLVTLAGLILRRRHGTRLIAWVMDRPLLQITRLRSVGSPKARLAALLNRLQCALYRRCHVVVALGRCMEAGLVADGIPADRLRVIGTWAEDDIASALHSPADARARCGLAEAFTVMYSGYAGVWHDFAPILEAVQELVGDPGLQFLFCGLGPGIDAIRRWTDAQPRSVPVHFRPLVPPEQRVASLCCGDVHLVSLRASMTGTCCPSKLDALLGLSRPVIAVAPAHSQTAIDLVESGAGFCAPTGPELVAAIRAMRLDPGFPEPWASAARRAFLRSHAASAVLPRWQALLEEPTASISRS